MKMKKILIFAGTTEGRRLSECLAASGLSHELCVATEYGEIVLKENSLVKVHRGRMKREEMQDFFRQGEYCAVVDATHPYATAVTQNIREAMEGTSIIYLRLKRETAAPEGAEQVVKVQTVEDCIAALEKTTGNILLTTGSKDLASFCASAAIKERLFVRVLPGVESLQLCEKEGISGRQILAMQGPFGQEMNRAIIHQYGIKQLVTKASGKAGGYPEKLEAARECQIPVYVIGAPKEEGYSFSKILTRLEEITGEKINREKRLHILLAGVGMGSLGSLTREVYEAIEEADILLGASRMLLSFQFKKEKRPYYRAEEIIPYLLEIQEEKFTLEAGKVVILFSGDSGFYSGCQQLFGALQKEIESGRLEAELKLMPGVSSVSYLAARLQESYQDADICSIHGKEIHGLSERIRHRKKTFLLLSGVKDLHRLGEILLAVGLEECEIFAGFQLSYPDERLLRLTPEECLKQQKEGLYTCLIKNPCVKKRRLTPAKTDGEFLRGRVPMTKEEVRQVSICKLRLEEDSVVYDVGSGTGSIAMEIAGLGEGLRVFAIEKKEDALSLIRQNQEKCGLQNIQVVEADAPEGLQKLPVPTHAFIGGSGGRMKEILDFLYQKNPRMRVVINAISLETICEIREVLSIYPMAEKELIQLQASRTNQIGGYHMMKAENPVWICSFTFGEENDKEKKH